MKKCFAYSSPQQIWRILISDSGKLILETRDVISKEVFYHCYVIEKGEKIFSGLQLDEKIWLGIEAVYKEIIFFHRFPKPDMPHHKEIIAFDIASQKILWQNSELSFLFVNDGKVYGFKQGFEERYFFALDFLTGEQLEDFGSDYITINRLRADADNAKDWSEYLYPEKFRNENDERISNAIHGQTNNLEIAGEVEYNSYGNLLFFNFHHKIHPESFVNNFCAIDLNTGKVILSEVLNANAKSLFTDSFFVYKNFLFLLKEKNAVVVYKIDSEE